MRKSDKKKNMGKANLIAETRYLESKGIVNENIFHADGIKEYQDSEEPRQYSDGEQRQENNNYQRMVDELKVKLNSELEVNPINLYIRSRRDGQEHTPITLTGVEHVEVPYGPGEEGWNPLVMFKVDGRMHKSLSVSPRGIEKNEFDSKEVISMMDMDSYKTLLGIMSNVIKVSNKFTDNEKATMVNKVMGMFGGRVIQPEEANSMDEMEPAFEGVKPERPLVKQEPNQPIPRPERPLVKQEPNQPIPRPERPLVREGEGNIDLGLWERFFQGTQNINDAEFLTNYMGALESEIQSARSFLNKLNNSESNIGGKIIQQSSGQPTGLDEGGEPFPVYHEMYGSAINAIDDYVKSRGFELDQEEYRMTYQDAFDKPRPGDTKSDSLTLYKDGKQQRKMMNVQIYGMDSGKFELNMYIN